MKTDNELIAEFMGGRRQASSIMKGGVFYIFDQYPNQVFDLSDDRGLGYHKSWDWLMPVMEKIEQMNYAFQIRRDEATLYKENTKGDFVGGVIGVNGKISAVYELVVEFIKWYNQQPK